MKGFKRVMLFA